MARAVEIKVRVENVEVIAQLLDDAYEALAALQSEAWDMLSADTREESSAVMQRIDTIRASA